MRHKSRTGNQIETERVFALNVNRQLRSECIGPAGGRDKKDAKDAVRRINRSGVDRSGMVRTEQVGAPSFRSGHLNVGLLLPS